MSHFDLLDDIKVFLLEAALAANPSDVDRKKALEAMRKTSAAHHERKSCEQKTTSKGEGTYKYPHAWHKSGKCDPIPVHVAAETTDADAKSGRAERTSDGQSSAHMKASEAHAAAHHAAKQAGYEDLAAKHRAKAEHHRDKAVELAHPNAKEDLHRVLTHRIEKPKSEAGASTEAPAPPRNPPSRGLAATHKF